MDTLEIITLSVRIVQIDKSLLLLPTIRGIGQPSPNLGVLFPSQIALLMFRS